MGFAKATLAFSNPCLPGFPAVEVEATADLDAALLCIPEKLASDLQLATVTKRRVSLPGGLVQDLPYVGPLQVNFSKRARFAGALFAGEFVLPGTIQMCDMDLVIDPNQQRVVANPTSPDPISRRA